MALSRYTASSVPGRPTPSVAPPVAPPVPQTPANNSMGGMGNMGTSPSTASATPGGNTTMSGMGGSMASGTMESGSSGSMSDVLRIQIEMAELENNLEALRSNRKAAEARFNSLLNRDQDLPVQTSDSLAQKLFSIEDNAVLDSIILSTTGQCLAQNRPVRQTARLVPVDLPVDDPRIFGRDDFPHGHHPTGTPVTELQP